MLPDSTGGVGELHGAGGTVGGQRHRGRRSNVGGQRAADGQALHTRGSRLVLSRCGWRQHRNAHRVVPDDRIRPGPDGGRQLQGITQAGRGVSVTDNRGHAHPLPGASGAVTHHYAGGLGGQVKGQHLPTVEPGSIEGGASPPAVDRQQRATGGGPNPTVAIGDGGQQALSVLIIVGLPDRQNDVCHTGARKHPQQAGPFQSVYGAIGTQRRVRDGIDAQRLRRHQRGARGSCALNDRARTHADHRAGFGRNRGQRGRSTEIAPIGAHGNPLHLTGAVIDRARQGGADLGYQQPRLFRVR